MIEVIEVLGEVRAGPPDDSDAERRIGSRSQRIVLAALVAHHGEVVSADALVDALWGDRPPRSARRTLSSYVSRLRGRLGEQLVITPHGYRLTAAADQVDALRFETLVRRATTASPGRGIEALHAAEDLWHGPPFGELADLPIVRPEAERLASMRLDARDRLAELLLRSGRATEAITTATELVTEQPLRESAWRVLVDAHAVSAPGEALRVYRRAVATLAEEGLLPTQMLRDAQARALAGEAVAADAAPGTTPVLPAPPSDRLFGRGPVIDRVVELVTDSRAVTLVGPGGVGKTRLALEVARRLRDPHRAAVLFVSFDAITDPGAVVPAVLEAAGLASLEEGVHDRLGGLAAVDLMLVLDNCEHVAGAAADLVEGLLTAGDGVRVLATSRQRLGVPDERLVEVPVLGAGTPDDDGIRMFVDRAAASGVHVEADDPTVARIVRSLDGLPLGIEMAAALLTSHGIDDLAQVVETDSGRLRSPRRGAPGRQRSLADLIDWSVGALDDDTAAAATRLSMLEGAFDLHLAEALLGRAAAASVHELVERSLLAADRQGRHARYRMLRTVRNRIRATSRADSLAAAARDHALLVVSRLEEQDRLLRSAEEGLAHRRVLDLYPDLRTAHSWACEHDRDLAVRLTRHLHVWSMSRQYGDPFRWAERLVTDPATTPPAAAVSYGQALFYRGRPDEAMTWLEAGLDRAVGADRLLLLESLGDVTLATGDLERSAAFAEQLESEAMEAADPYFAVLGRTNRALALRYGGDRRGARRFLDGFDAVAPSCVGWAAYATAEVVADEDPATAAEALHTAIARADEVGNRFLGGVARVGLSALYARLGEPGRALEDLLSAMQDWRRRGMHAYLMTAARNLVVLLERLGRHDEAARLLGAVKRSAKVATFGDEAAELEEVERDLDAGLGSTRLGGLLAQGAARPLGELVDELSGTF